MKRNMGFTIIEMLIVMGLIAVIFAAMAPSFSRMYKKAVYGQNVQAIFKALDDARTNAISNKKCPNDESSVSWKVILEKSTLALPLQAHYELLCDSAATPNQVALKADFAVHTAFDDFYFNGSSTAGEDAPELIFLSGSSQVKILEATTPSPTRRDDIRIVMNFPEAESFRTICLNRIAGFPTLNKSGDTCLE